MYSLETLSKQFKGRIPICAHGTDEVPDAMFQEMIKRGVSKVSPLCSSRVRRKVLTSRSTSTHGAETRTPKLLEKA